MLYSRSCCIFALNITSGSFIHLRITTVPNYSLMLSCLPLKIEKVFGYAGISLDEAVGPELDGTIWKNTHRHIFLRRHTITEVFILIATETLTYTVIYFYPTSKVFTFPTLSIYQVLSGLWALSS